MAYARAENPSRRLVTLGAVGAIHAIAIYAIVNGLSISFIRVPDPPPISATNQPLPTPVPSHDPPRHRTPDRQEAHPTDTVVMPTTNTPLYPLTPATPEWTIDPLPTGPATPPIPRPPLPSLARAAQPRGVPGNWVTPDDYPVRDLREGHAGAVGFRLSLGTDGRVTGCTVTRSSGFPGLDAATCALLASRARFDPARDDHGAAATGSFASTVHWQIPD